MIKIYSVSRDFSWIQNYKLLKQIKNDVFVNVEARYIFPLSHENKFRIPLKLIIASLKTNSLGLTYLTRLHVSLICLCEHKFCHNFRDSLTVLLNQLSTTFSSAQTSRKKGSPTCVFTNTVLLHIELLLVSNLNLNLKCKILLF